MRRYVLPAAILAATVAGVPTLAQAQDHTIRLAHGASSKHPFHNFALRYAEAVAAKTGGKVKIEVFGDRKLGEDKDVLLAVKAGTIDSGLVSSVLFALIVRKSSFDALQLPFVVTSYENLAKMLTSEPAAKMLASLDDIGIKGLSFGEAGQRHFLSGKGLVKKLPDFKGLKTRIVPVPLHKAMWQAVGANPVGIAYGEVYTSMQTKVIDAVEFNISSVESENLFENAKYLTLTGHYFWPGVLIHNKAKFDKLPDDIKAAMIAAGKEVIEPHTLFVRDHEMASAERMKKKGVQIASFDDLVEMRKIMEPIVSTWEKRDPIIAEYVAEARRLEGSN
jgi:tripartite ATP-independent transporter DctP family solute receptor